MHPPEIIEQNMSDYVLTLCREYLDLIEQMRSGRYSTAELHELDSQRQYTHNELCRLTGYDRTVDMARAARLILRQGGL